MKKSLLISVLLMLCAMVSQAQQKVIIKLTDGTTIERFVWELSEITFADAGSVLQSQAPAVEEAVDLVLSVRWAPKKLVATTRDKNIHSLILVGVTCRGSIKPTRCVISRYCTQQ